MVSLIIQKFRPFVNTFSSTKQHFLTFLFRETEKREAIRLVLIRMFTNFGRDVFFSADLCYNGSSKKAFLREEGGTRSVTEGARVTLSFRKFRCIALSLSRLRRQLPPGGSLWTRSCIFRGMGFARCLCNTKAKLAINRTVNRNLTEEIIVWRNIFIFLLLFLL